MTCTLPNPPLHVAKKTSNVAKKALNVTIRLAKLATSPREIGNVLPESHEIFEPC